MKPQIECSAMGEPMAVSMELSGPLKHTKYAKGLLQVVGEVVESLQKGKATWKEPIFLDSFKIKNLFILVCR
jgi:hypothetical protein